jgi:high affinity Mn2+ porin
VPVSGSFGLYRSPNAFTEGGGFLEGVQASYNLMLRNRIVLGIEAWFTRKIAELNPKSPF